MSHLGSLSVADVNGYIEKFDEVLAQEPNISVVPYVRESRTCQKAKGNLEDQARDLLRELKKRSANIAHPIFKEVVKGSIQEFPFGFPSSQYFREWL